MNKYIVKYTDKSGDLCSIWVAADSIEEAKYQARREYWDVDTIISCYEAD